jgi:excisionase family DNA binding protein
VTAPLVVIDDDLARDLLRAIGCYAEHLKSLDRRLPRSLLSLADGIVSARARQEATGLAPVGVDPEGGAMDKLLLTAKEAAGALGVGERTVQRMIADGKLEAVKIGNATRVKRATVEALVDDLQPVALDLAARTGPEAELVRGTPVEVR